MVQGAETWKKKKIRGGPDLGRLAGQRKACGKIGRKAFEAGLPAQHREAILRGEPCKNETLLYQMGVHFKR